MPSAPPAGEPAPVDGSLAAAALAEVGTGPFGVYVHVPCCTVRCGYCDFNTYTVDELGLSGVPGSSRTTYAGAAVEEVRLARRVLGDRELGLALDRDLGGVRQRLERLVGATQRRQRPALHQRDRHGHG